MFLHQQSKHLKPPQKKFNFTVKRLLNLLVLLLDYTVNN